MKAKADYKKLKGMIVSIMNDGLTHTKTALINDLRDFIPNKDKDRVIRDCVAQINADSKNYGDTLIIATSDVKGYRLGTNKEDIQHFKNERLKRADETLAPIEKANRLLGRM